MMRGSAELLAKADAYFHANLCPLPRVVGHIEPSAIDEHGEIHAITWGQYKVSRPDWNTIAIWFDHGDATTLGITLLTGTSAGKGCAPLQILDLETSEVFEAFLEAAHYAGHADILHRCIIEHTPSGGAHFGFLCHAIGDEPKLTLARRKADNKLLIELLQHQPCTVAPTCFQSKSEHSAGVPYRLEHGSWERPLEISSAQRQALLTLARSFNEVPEKVRPGPRERTGTGQLPGDVLNGAADATWWSELLTQHGWKDVSRSGLRSQGITYWQRPGKIGREPSATLGACGQYFYVFSTNATPFESDTAYTPFAAYGLLEHNGDFKAAAKTLAQQHTNGTYVTPPTSDPLPLSDYTNAEAFLRRYGENLRYCHPWDKWLIWRGTHWEVDQSGQVMRWAKETIKALATRVQTLEDEQKIGAWLAHIKTSLSTSKLDALTRQARCEVPIAPQALDVHPWLLNCTNGTLDLCTGTLYPARREDYLTQQIPVAYDSAATCPTWDAFLSRIMAGSETLICFLQKAIGYALTGDIREQVLLILWGEGANGKSTFLNTILTLFGPYGMKATSELLMTSQSDRHPTERADLFGKRFVAAIETEENRRFSEVFVKEATGGDPIRARRMHEDFWQFQPTHKTFLGTNHLPQIRGTDHAIWRRIRLIPFTVTIPEADQDKTLPDKLRAEFSGILAWAVRGCLAWQQEGLGEPDAVRDATKTYRSDMDVIGQFLEEMCFTNHGNPNVLVKASTLYAAYQKWCETGGEQAKPQRQFGQALTGRGFERKTNNGVWYVGLGLMASSTEPTEPTEPKYPLNSSVSLAKTNSRKIGSVPSVPSVGYEEGLV
jgi:P4 family phage/plasmid primase-like protien